jgi:hypothetical protein
MHSGAIIALTQRELIRFLRQRTRIIGAVGQPVIFWLLFGAGLRTSFRPPSWAVSAGPRGDLPGVLSCPVSRH